MWREDCGCSVSASSGRIEGRIIGNVDRVRGEVVARFVLLKFRLTA
jgi:hypothetical protein